MNARTLSLFAFLMSLILAVSPAHAQSSGEETTTEGCEVGELDMSTADASGATAASARPSSEARSPAEQRVQEIIRQDGIHVVHLWAPWCSNSTGELGNGWDALVQQNEDVSFTFVTIWNAGADGTQTLDAYDLPERIVELTAPGGSETNEADRITSFLDLPVTWIPTTWVFHNNGELAFAMNYGEMQMETIQRLIDVTRQDW